MGILRTFEISFYKGMDHYYLNGWEVMVIGVPANEFTYVCSLDAKPKGKYLRKIKRKLRRNLKELYGE